MKKKILSLGVIAILLIMLICLTGCGEVKDGQGTNKTSKNSLVSVAKVGDYVDYKTQAGSKYTATKENTGSQKEQIFETTGEEKWRVLSINDDGTVNLISEEGVTTKFEKKFELQGKAGFSNGIQELNNIADLYANGEHAVSGRSMKMQDIIDLIGIDNIAKVYERQYEKDLSEYVGNEKLEEMYKLGNKDYGKTYTVDGVTYTINSGLKIESVTATDHGIYDACTDSGILDLLKIQKDETRQIETRGPIILADEIFKNHGDGTGRYDCLDCCLGSYTLYEKSGYLGESNIVSIKDGSEDPVMYRGYYIRPVITLEKNLKVEGGDGTKENPFILK